MCAYLIGDHTSVKQRENFVRADLVAVKSLQLTYKNNSSITLCSRAPKHHLLFSLSTLPWLVQGSTPESFLSQPDFSNLSGHRKQTQSHLTLSCSWTYYKSVTCYLGLHWCFVSVWELLLLFNIYVVVVPIEYVHTRFWFIQFPGKESNMLGDAYF